MINLQSGDVNKLRQMLASGQITEDQLLAMSFHGGDSAPQQAPQNALAQALSPQQAFAQGDTSGDLPMGSMRNEVTGKITYFQPDPQAPRTNADPGFSDTPYPLPSARPQSPRARLYGYGDGGLTDLGEDTSGAIPLDYSRGQIEVPGVGKAHYSRDGRFAVARGPNGEAVKVMLGYDAAASDRRNDMALKRDSARANLEQTREQTGLLRDKRAMMAEAANAPPAPPVVKPTAGQNEADKEFAKEYVSFKASGGYADTVKQLEQLRGVSAALGKDDSLTGNWVGMQPDAVLAVTDPQALAAKNAVEEVVQRNLRLVLGAQFTEKEGERLIARAYNPRLNATENKARVDRLIKQIETAARVKQDAADYFEANGTIVGWGGRLPTWQDFNPDGGASQSSAPDAAGRVVGQSYDTPRGKLVWLGNGRWRAP